MHSDDEFNPESNIKNKNMQKKRHAHNCQHNVTKQTTSTGNMKHEHNLDVFTQVKH